MIPEEAATATLDMDGAGFLSLCTQLTGEGQQIENVEIRVVEGWRATF